MVTIKGPLKVKKGKLGEFVKDKLEVKLPFKAENLKLSKEPSFKLKDQKFEVGVVDKKPNKPSGRTKRSK